MSRKAWSAHVPQPRMSAIQRSAVARLTRSSLSAPGTPSDIRRVASRRICRSSPLGAQ